MSREPGSTAEISSESVRFELSSRKFSLEIGASPLEPYNGDIAINEIRENIKCIILAATDPYAVYGLMKVFDITPDIVTGIASNTLAGKRMVQELCKVKALNLIDATTTKELKQILESGTGLSLKSTMSNDKVFN